MFLPSLISPCLRYETASSSEDDMAQMRPVFVQKGNRSTIADREAQERADAERYAVAEEKLRKRVEESRNLVAQTRQEEINQAHMLYGGVDSSHFGIHFTFI